MNRVQAPGDQATIRPPDAVRDVLGRLWGAGHAAYVVGGSLRDVLLGREPADWDLATSARPDAVQTLFPESAYENRFGTVGVQHGGAIFEVTTFRSDHDYADFRRPHRVVFGDRIEDDLARRDFTVNAMAWGAEAPTAQAASPDPVLLDPFGGRADLASRTLRAVGTPRTRFEEDALRMVRAVRLAAVLEFGVEAATLAGIQARASLAAHLSGERLGAELERLLAAPTPSIGLRLLAGTGLLEVLSPELAAQRGLPQNKIPGDDCWDHTVRTVDAAPVDRPVVRLAALLHDIGKPATMADGHFHGHDAAGADLARAFLERLRTPKAVTDRVVELVRHHMFLYEPAWGDAGVRRFIRRVGRDALPALFALREADNVGSGQPPEAHGLAELRERVAEQLAGRIVLHRGDLAIDGNALIAELGLEPGPRLGRIIDALVERAIADPAINERPTLLLLAQGLISEGP